MTERSRTAPSIDSGQRPVTIREVAVAAGVSHQTVSRVVNGSPRVTESTRAAVRDAMLRLHWTPDGAAQGLGLRKRSSI